MAASPFDAAGPADAIVTVDLTRHPPDRPLGMLLAPGAGGRRPSGSGGDAPTGDPFFPAPPPASTSTTTATSSPTSSNVTLVAGWEHDRGGLRLGPVQRSGLVRLGDRLVRINGRDVTDWTFREVMDALKGLVSSDRDAASGSPSSRGGGRRRLKTLGFAPSGTPEWSRGARIDGTSSSTADALSAFLGLFHHMQQASSSDDDGSSAAPRVVHEKRGYSFVSFVGRWRVAADAPRSDREVARERGEAPSDARRRQRRDSDRSNGHGQQRQHSENSTSELERQLNKEPSIHFDEDPSDDDIVPVDDPKPPSPTPVSSGKAGGDGDDPPPPDAPTSAADGETSAYVQYEIQCHILFRDLSSFPSRAAPHPHPPAGGGGGDVRHRSWSVWKRYSELRTLDDDLRRGFGWQMDALDDGRGVAFPSPRGLESWWYGFRNGGGTVTSLMGGSSGVVDAGTGGGCGGGEAKDDVAVSAAASGTDAAARAGEGDESWGSSLIGLFRTGPHAARAAAAAKKDVAVGYDKSGNASRGGGGDGDGGSDASCPFPTEFVERRRKELASYWTSLMGIEDIFEFGDMTSHKFGKTMAAFLEVDRVLLSRKNRAASVEVVSGSNGNHLHEQHDRQSSSASKITFPAINEDESDDDAYRSTFRPAFTAPLPSDSLLLPPVGVVPGMTATTLSDATREVSGINIHDDDVSILSDGTGAFGDGLAASPMSRRMNQGGPMARSGQQRPMVDIVPLHYSNGGGGSGEGSDGEIVRKSRMSSSSTGGTSSVVSGSRRRSRGRAGAAAPRAKPAFQRQFLPP